MVLDDDRINWPHTIGWCALAWVMFWLGASAWFATLGSGRFTLTSMIAPLLVIFVAGVIERESWWVRASLLSLAPLALLLLYTVLNMAIGGDERGSDPLGVGILLVAGPLALGLGGLLVAVAAALGVHVGQQRAEGGHA